MLLRLAILFTSALIGLNSAAQASKPSIIVYEGASPEYKQLIKRLQDRDLPNKAEFSSRLLEFAEKGEPSAVETLLGMYKSDSREQIGFLFSLIDRNKDNLAAMLCLGKILANHKDPKCLQWFERAENTKKHIYDKDFWINYAGALLSLGPNNEDTLRKAWQLLKDWPAATTEDLNVRILGGIYFELTQKATQNKFTDLVCELCLWDKKTHQHPNITQGIFGAIANTPYVDILRQRTGILMAGLEMNKVRDSASLREEVSKTIEEARRLALEKERQTKLVAENVVKGNVLAVLQMADVKGIPTNEKYQRYFQGFNPGEPSEQHIMMWARIMVSLKRAELINYADRELALQDYIKILDNVTLERFCIAALRELFMLDDE